MLSGDFLNTCTCKRECNVHMCIYAYITQGAPFDASRLVLHIFHLHVHRPLGQPYIYPQLPWFCTGMVGSAGDGDSQLAILRVARVLFEAAPSDAAEATPEWTRKLIAAQASVHERIGVIGNKSVNARAEKILHACLVSRPHLLGEYLQVLTAEDKSGDSLVALSAVSSFAVSLPSYEGKLGSLVFRDLRLENHAIGDGGYLWLMGGI